MLYLNKEKLSESLKNTRIVIGKGRRLSVKSFLYYSLLVFIVTLGLEDFQTMTYKCPFCNVSKKPTTFANAAPIKNAEVPYLLDTDGFSKVKLYVVSNEGEKKYLCVTEGNSGPIVKACMLNTAENVLGDTFSTHRLNNSRHKWLLALNLTVNDVENFQDCEDAVGDLGGNYGIVTDKRQLRVKTLCRRLTRGGPPSIEYQFQIEFDRPRHPYNLRQNSNNTFRIRAFCSRRKPKNNSDPEDCYIKIMPSGSVKLRSLTSLASNLHSCSFKKSNFSMYSNLITTEDVARQMTADLRPCFPDVNPTETSNYLNQKTTLFELVKILDSND